MHDLLSISSQKKFSSDLFKEIVRKYVKNGIDKEISSFIDEGKIITLDDINLPIKSALVKKYDLGFNGTILQVKKQIADIDTTSNAYQSGLRNGQKVLEYHLPKGFENLDQTITIRTSNQEHQFAPGYQDKVQTYQVQTFQISDNMSEKEQELFSKFFGT